MSTKGAAYNQFSIMECKYFPLAPVAVKDTKASLFQRKKRKPRKSENVCVSNVYAYIHITYLYVICIHLIYLYICKYIQLFQNIFSNFGLASKKVTSVVQKASWISWVTHTPEYERPSKDKANQEMETSIKLFKNTFVVVYTGRTKLHIHNSEVNL